MHDHTDEADKKFAAIRGSILDQAKGRCEFCGHHSAKYQEVHHLDDDHNNNSPTNLVCACPLCHQDFHIGLAGMREGGEIYYVPELTQEECNAMALMLWIVDAAADAKRLSKDQELLYTRLSAEAKGFAGFLETRRHPVLAKIKKLLEDTAFPKELIPKIKKEHISLNLLSNILMSQPDDVYDRRQDLLGGLRIVPKAARFQERIKFWAEEDSARLPVTSWEQILQPSELEKIVLASAEQLNRVKQSMEA
jgi:intracellular multiplication protein IcmJ